MPGFLVNKAASVTCSHGGSATPSKVSARVKVGGQPVVLQAAPWSIAGCPSQPPPVGPGVDTVGVFAPGAARVKVEGQPVLLADARSVAATTGTPLTIANPGQTRVKGV